jgi:hypothetical protein
MVSKNPASVETAALQGGTPKAASPTEDVGLHNIVHGRQESGVGRNRRDTGRDAGRPSPTEDVGLHNIANSRQSSGVSKPPRHTRRCRRRRPLRCAHPCLHRMKEVVRSARRNDTFCCCVISPSVAYGDSSLIRGSQGVSKNRHDTERDIREAVPYGAHVPMPPSDKGGGA